MSSVQHKQSKQVFELVARDGVALWLKNRFSGKYLTDLAVAYEDYVEPPKSGDLYRSRAYGTEFEVETVTGKGRVVISPPGSGNAFVISSVEKFYTLYEKVEMGAER